MSEQGIVVYTPYDGFVVVQHSSGFAVLELLDDETGIGCGDALRANGWEGLGTDTLYRGDVAYEAGFWGSHVRLQDAQEKILGFVCNLLGIAMPTTSAELAN